MFISPGATAPGTPAAEPGRQNAVLAGGLVSWLPDLLAVSVVFCPLFPLPPFPGGEGGDLGYFMQGASPLASPGLGGARHWGRGRTTRPAGGVPGWSPAYPAFAFFSAPYPPTPFPGGEGGDFYFISPGATAPGTPAAEPGRKNAVLAGGLGFLVAGFTCRISAFLPPSPRPPSRREGGDFLFVSPGATAPGTPAAEPIRRGFYLWKTVSLGYAKDLSLQ